MTLIRTIGLAAALSMGVASTAFAVTGRDDTGKPNGTAALSDHSSGGDSANTGSYAAGQTPPAGTGTSVGPGSANHDANKPLGYGKGAGENSSVGKR
jgi:hypothetical protein